MRAIAGLTLAVMIMAGVSQPALAADPIAFSTSTSESLPVYDTTAFDWTGFYAGVYGVGIHAPTPGLQYGLGAALGATAAFDAFVLGAEASVAALTGPSNVYGQVIARAGVLVTDDVLVYAAGGYGTSFGAPLGDHLVLGGGVELAVTDDVTLRGQYLHGFPLGANESMDQVTFGASFHF